MPPPRRPPRKSRAVAAAALLGAALACLAMPTYAASPARPATKPNLRVHTITGTPQLAFAPAGQVMSVGAFARIEATFDINGTIRDCYNAANDMKHVWQLTPKFSFAEKQWWADKVYQSMYKRHRMELIHACDDLRDWKEAKPFYTEHDVPAKRDTAELTHSLLYFATAPPTYQPPITEQHGNVTRSTRSPTLVALAVVGGAALLYTVAKWLFGSSEPAWTQEAISSTASNVANNAGIIRSLAGRFKYITDIATYRLTVGEMCQRAQHITDHANNLGQAFYQLQRGQISKFLLQPKDILTALDKLKRQASRSRMHLAVQTVPDILLLPAFGVIDKSSLKVVIAIPAIVDLLHLHRFAGTPLITQHSDGTRDLMVPQPEYDAIAASNRGQSHALLSNADLDRCLRIKDTYMCAALPIRNNRKDSCLGSLYSANSDAIHTQCTFRPHHQSWHVVQEPEQTYIISTTATLPITTSCPAGSSSARSLVWGVFRVQVPAGCTAITPHFSITAPLAAFATAELYKTIHWRMDKPVNTTLGADQWKTLLHAASINNNNALATKKSIQAHLEQNQHFYLYASAVVLTLLLVTISCCYFRNRVSGLAKAYATAALTPAATAIQTAAASAAAVMPTAPAFNFITPAQGFTPNIPAVTFHAAKERVHV